MNEGTINKRYLINFEALKRIGYYATTVRGSYGKTFVREHDNIREEIYLNYISDTIEKYIKKNGKIMQAALKIEEVQALAEMIKKR